MNANDTTSAPSSIIVKLAQAVGNGAAYALWYGAVLVTFGFVLMVFNFNTPAREPIGEVFAWIVFGMMVALGIMVLCAKILRARNAF